MSGDNNIRKFIILKFKLSPKKETYERKIQGALQIVAIVGGFTNVCTKVFGWVGKEFSKNVLPAAKAQAFFYTKKSKKLESSKKKQSKKLYSTINISAY